VSAHAERDVAIPLDSRRKFERAGRRAVDGRTFVLSAPDHVPAIWGKGDQVAWSEGERNVFFGPQGLVKTTLQGRLILARAGIIKPVLLGMPVVVADKPTLLIAADRPRQIARSLRRMVTEEDGDTLADRLEVWEGPLPFDIGKHPEMLLPFVQQYDVRDVHIDSLKDVAIGLANDEVGAAINYALGTLIAERYEVTCLHHPRKANADNRKPSSLDDVYGSTWITSGAGSVICLWGQAGDPIADFTHLKHPAEEISRFEIEIHHQTGELRRVEQPDAYGLLQLAGKNGITAQHVAEALYGKHDRANVEKARRQLEKLIQQHRATSKPGNKATSTPTTYYPREDA
jgi:replicative DNA helicase